MVCAFGGLLGLQPSFLHVARPRASWRLSDDELLLATTRSSKRTKAATTTTLNSPTTVSPSPLPPSKTSALPTRNLPAQKTVADKVKMDYASQMFLLTPNGTSSSHAAAVAQREQLENLYLGYETWLPVAPKVKNKPRTIYNAVSLAYLGDCIYELYARRHFLFPPLSLDEYNSHVMAVVRCETQDMLLKKLLKDGFLTDDERDVVRWGKNVQSGKTKAIKRVGVSTYKRASSLETLIGYLYLTDAKRLEEIMLNMGFSAGASSSMIAQK